MRQQPAFLTGVSLGDPVSIGLLTAGVWIEGSVERGLDLLIILWMGTLFQPFEGDGFGRREAVNPAGEFGVEELAAFDVPIPNADFGRSRRQRKAPLGFDQLKLCVLI